MFSADVRKRVPVSETCFGARPRRFDPERSGPALWAPAGRQMDRVRLRPLRGSHPLRPLPAFPGVRSVRTQTRTSEVSEQGALNATRETASVLSQCKQAAPRGMALVCRCVLWPRLLGPSGGTLPMGGTQAVSPLGLCSVVGGAALPALPACVHCPASLTIAICTPGVDGSLRPLSILRPGFTATCIRAAHHQGDMVLFVRNASFRSFHCQGGPQKFRGRGGG